VKDFFISYNKADRSWAEWIAWQLEATGKTTVIQAWDFRPGSNFIHDMQSAASEAERTIAVLSQSYLESRFTKPEWYAAFAQDPTGEKGILLPVRVGECELKGLLPQIVYIELVGQDKTAAKNLLLAGIKRGRAKPDEEPPFPSAAERSITKEPRFPGSLPPVWNIPFQRNPNFTGRTTLLDTLKQALAGGERAALTQAVHGLGGVGKTQLAIEFAYRHSGDYDLVWWVPSEHPEELKANFAALAGRLDPRMENVQQQSKLVEFARDVLEGRHPQLLAPGRSLVIFDNVEDPAHLDGCLPRGGGGHVIITSRNQHFGNKAKTLEVQTFERIESIQFLRQRVVRVESSGPQHPFLAGTAPPDSRSGGSKTRSQPPDPADQLAAELGDLPLALAQAAAFIVETKTSFARYLELYRSRHAELWKREQPPDDYDERVDTTWSLNIGEIDKQNPSVAELLNICSFLAPNAIPRKLLVEQSKHLPPDVAEVVSDDLEWANAIRLLGRFSLVESDGESITMHRVVQAVIRDRLVPEQRHSYAAAAVKLVNGAFPYDADSDPAAWPICKVLLPHAQSAATHAEVLGIEQEATGRLLNQVGIYLRTRAEFVEARNVLERAASIDEKTFGLDHPNVARDVSNLGVVLKDLADLSGAKQEFERALKIDEKAFGPEHPQVAIHVNNLGSVLQELGDLPGARQAFEWALKIGEKAFGAEHPNVATCVNNLGLVVKRLGDLPGAKQAYERALKIDEKAYGPEHPEVAADINNIGAVLRDLGDLPGARQAFDRALKIDEKAFGPEHPNVARDVSNLGMVRQELGDLPGARQAFERALKIGEKAFGPEHSQVGIFVNNLGGVLQGLGDLPGAKQALERALGIFRKVLGDEHPSTQTVRGNLEAVKRLLGGKHQPSE